MKKLLWLALLLAACESPTVTERTLNEVYEFRVFTTKLQVLRWPIGTTVHVFTVSDADTTRAQWLRAGVQDGIAAWNAAALYGEVAMTEAKNLQEADVVVQYTQSLSPVDASNCPPGGSNAFTTFCLASGNDHLAIFPLREGGGGRVKFLVSVRTTAATDAETVRRLVTHELGHVLGIAQHSPHPTDLMYAGTLVTDQPSLGDRATLEVLYHTAADITP